MLFRPLDRCDFPLLQKWLASPHVNRWWHENLDLAGVEAKFGQRIEGTEPTHVFMVEVEGQAVGWIQWYWWSDYPAHAAQLGAAPGSVGIDLAIGEEATTGRGLGPAAIVQFLKQIVPAESVFCARGSQRQIVTRL